MERKMMEALEAGSTTLMRQAPMTLAEAIARE